MNAAAQLRLLGLLWLTSFTVSLDFDVPYFRPFELIRTEGPNFRRNRRVEMEAYGALSYRFHNPDIRARRNNVFTTDAAGFRNPPMDRPSIIVIGDSFVVGVGVSDEETIPQALSDRLGVPVYNYGAQGNEGPPYFLSDRRFGMPGELIIYMPAEGGLAPLRMPRRSPSTPGPPENGGSKRLPTVGPLASLEALGSELQRLNVVANRDNGLRRLASLQFHGAQRLLFGDPNRIEVDGEPALVLTLDEQLRTRATSEAELSDIVDSYVRFEEILQQRGARLVVAPIPESGSVYEEYFRPEERARAQHPTLVQRLEAALAARGIAVVDLYGVFRSNRYPYLYLRDDTHLDTPGVALAATHLATELVRMGFLAERVESEE